MNKKNFLIIAHRGESHDAPENTHSAINLAWQRNADAVEIDVQMTKDGKIVVIHDKSTLRTGKIPKRISNNTYEDLLQVDIGIFKGSKWKGERIPLLADLLDYVPKIKTLFIEIKSNDEIVEPLIKLIYQKKLMPNQITFIGFDINTMKLIKKSLPKFESYWIIEGKQYKSYSLLNNSIDNCKNAGLDGLDVQEKKYLNSEVINIVKSNRLKILTWTVDDPARAMQLYLDGIDGITTNRASWLKSNLKEQKII